MRDEEKQSCYVCLDRCLCAKCESEAINSDLQRMQNLCTQDEDEAEVKEKFNESKLTHFLLHVTHEIFQYLLSGLLSTVYERH